MISITPIKLLPLDSFGIQNAGGCMRAIMNNSSSQLEAGMQVCVRHRSGPLPVVWGRKAVSKAGKYDAIGHFGLQI